MFSKKRTFKNVALIGAAFFVVSIFGVGASLYSGASHMAWADDFSCAFKCDGTDGDDTIYGSSSADAISAEDGDDTVYGYGGADMIVAGDDEDTVYGGNGGDSIYGGGHADTLYGGYGTDTVIGGAGNDDIFGGANSDILSGRIGDDDIYGGSGALDRLYGREGDDEFWGGTGQDFFYCGEAEENNGGDVVHDFNEAEGDWASSTCEEVEEA